MPIPFLNSITLNKNEIQDFKVFNYAGNPSPLTGTDAGYMWYNTAVAKMRFWDGSLIRDFLDSQSSIAGSQITGNITGRSGGLSGGDAGTVVYQSATNTTAFLPLGSASQVMAVNPGATAPQWINQSAIAAGSATTATTATNVAGGAAGSLHYQTGAGVTGMLAIGSTDQVLKVTAGLPSWVNQSTLTAGKATDVAGGTAGALLYQSAPDDTGFISIGAANTYLISNGTSPVWTAGSGLTIGKAVDIAFGTAGDLLYQSAANDTAFLGIGTAGTVLVSSGTAPQWAAQSTLTAGKATNVAGGAAGKIVYQTAADTTGFVDVGTSGQILTSSGTGPQWTSKSAIALSGFGAPTADIDIGGFKITNSAVIGVGDTATTLATKGYVDSVAQGLSVKASCVVATTSNITLSSPGAITIDGVNSATFTSGTTRILVKDQSTQSQNGIYIWNGSASAMTRSTDADTWAELVGAFTFVESGTANINSGWVCNVAAGGTLGTTPVTWSKFSQAGTYTAGNGMVQSGTAFHFAQSANYDIGRIPFTSSVSTIGFSSSLQWNSSTNCLGIGTASPLFDIHVERAGQAELRLKNTSGSGLAAISLVGGSQTNPWYIYTDASRNFIFQDNTTERLRIDSSGNLLVGPGVAQYTAANRGNITVAGTGEALFGLSVNNTPSGYLWGTTTNVEIGAPAGRYISFSINGEKARIDSAGNMGLGVTPNAWPAGYKAIQVNHGSFWAQTGNLLAISSNAYYDGAYKYLGNGYATLVNQYQGQHIWYTAGNNSSGANAPLTFTQAMTLDASGRLSVGGTPTGTAKFEIQGVASGERILFSQTANNTGARTMFSIGYRTGGTSSTGYNAIVCATETTFDDSYGIRFNTGASGAESARIDRFGNLGVGTIPPEWATTFKSIHVGPSTASAFMASEGATTYIGDEGYYNSGWKHSYAGVAATMYKLSAGIHDWYSADSGASIGSAISYTLRMRLTKAGQLGIGVGPTGQAGGGDIQLGDGKAIIGQGKTLSFVTNGYFDGAWKCYANGNFTQYYANDGDHIFFSGSGTTLALTPLERLRLNSSGNLLLGIGSNIIAGDKFTAVSTAGQTAGLYNFSTTASSGSEITLGRSKNATVGTNTAVVSGDALGAITFRGADGTSYIPAAKIAVEVDGVSGTNDMPGRISLQTTADGASAPTERLRIKSSGQVRFVPQAEPTGEAGDVYYDSGTNRLRYNNGSGWVETGTRKFAADLSGSLSTFTVTHNLNTRDITVQVRRTSGDFGIVYADVLINNDNSVDIVFATTVTGSNYRAIIIG